MKRRRIIILQDRLRSGGTERQSLWLVKVLQSEAWSARLLFFQPPGGDPAPGEPEFDVLQRISTPFPWYAPGLIRKLGELRADLVLCMGRNANAYAAWIRASAPDVNVVSTCRTNRHLPFFYRRGIKRSHHCLTNSEWGAGRVLEAKLKEAGDITTIPNALLRPELLELDRSPPARARARAVWRLPEDVPVLCNVASFLPGKNKQGLLRAFARGPSEKAILLLAGDGPELAPCKKLAKRLGIGRRVCFLGHVEDIAPVLQASDLFVSTAWRDGLPNALIEAQAAGLPVVAFDAGGSAEAFIEGKTGWSVPNGDENAFAETTGRFLAAPEEWAGFGAAARAQVRERFLAAKIAARYHSFLRDRFEGEDRDLRRLGRGLT